jgi:hypothetical protein
VGAQRVTVWTNEVQAHFEGTPMDISKMLQDLYAERRQIEEAIGTLVRLSTGQKKRRGRPPKWMAQAREGEGQVADTRKRRPFSPETRKRMGAAQRKRWANAKIPPA